MAAAKFKKASEYWSKAQELEKQAEAINIVPDGKTVDENLEAQRDKLTDEAKKLKERTLILQEKGDELEAKSRPDRPVTGNPYAGRTMPASAVPAWAAKRRMTIEQAQKALADAEVVIQ